ncbi:MAG TPA: trigger factor, partial [Candidatus Acidoferrales bacterium]|jgi:trigger factor|nr:trigger factor [Candidatus Acidoferrales bacterium]
MSEATCRRELDLEIPAETVQKAVNRVSKEFARVARVPGFRPGKAPITLIQRRFADDIKSEVLQSLVPEQVEKAVSESKMVPVTQPQIDKVDFAEGGPVKFRAVFEVLPEFELGQYKDLEVEVEDLKVEDADVEKGLEELRDRAATFVPVEGRAIADGDYAQLKLNGIPMGGGEPLEAESVLCHVGGEETMEPFNENLRGASAGDKKSFDVTYPSDYPDAKLQGKTYTYAVEVLGIKEKKRPELTDEFAKDVSDAQTLDELRKKMRDNLEAARTHRQNEQQREKLLAQIVKGHDFPVPEALVEHQMDSRLERTVRSLASQGVDPRAMNVDWVALRNRQKDRSIEDVKAELLLDRIATAEKIEVSDEEVDKEIAALAERSGESATVVRANLTRQGALDRMKSKIRSEKTLDWLCSNSRTRTITKEN